MQKRAKTVSFRLSKEETAILEDLMRTYDAKGSTLSERFRAFLKAWDEDQTPWCMRSFK